MWRFQKQSFGDQSAEWLNRSPGGGHGNPLQYSCLGNPMDREEPGGYSPWGCKDSDTTEWLNNSCHLIRETCTRSAGESQRRAENHSLHLPLPWQMGRLSHVPSSWHNETTLYRSGYRILNPSWQVMISLSPCLYVLLWISASSICGMRQSAIVQKGYIIFVIQKPLWFTASQESSYFQTWSRPTRQSDKRFLIYH